MLFQVGLVFPESLPDIQIPILMFPRDREMPKRCPIVTVSIDR